MICFRRSIPFFRIIRLAAPAVLLLFLFSCATLPPPQEPYGVGYREKGVASWYGKPFHGRKTANGEVYNMYKLSAAHRLMPLGTVIKVTHRGNGRSVRVRVNDRGPFIRGRTLDLSFGAAKRLGMVESGTAPIMIEILKTAPDARKSASRRYTIQVGAFQSQTNARKLAEELSLDFSHVYLARDPQARGGVYRVRVGSMRKREAALELARRLSREKGVETFVTIREP